MSSPVLWIIKQFVKWVAFLVLIVGILVGGGVALRYAKTKTNILSGTPLDTQDQSLSEPKQVIKAPSFLPPNSKAQDLGGGWWIFEITFEGQSRKFLYRDTGVNTVVVELAGAPR
jgi:hypothetical protein